MTKITLSGYIIVPPEELDTTLGAIAEHIHLSQNETGCMTFQLTQDPENPHRFTVYEEFCNRDAFDAHQQRIKNSHWGKVTRNVKRHYQITEE